MAKRRSFVPESPVAASLEGRVVLSTFGKIGDWFSSQYSHVKDDLGITHKKSENAAAGILDMWKNSAKLSKPTHTHTHAVAAGAHHPTATASAGFKLK